MQRILVERQFKSTETVDGVVGEKTKAAIEYAQRSAGLPVDGVAGPLTKRALTLNGLRDDAPPDGALKRVPTKPITWQLVRSTVPTYLTADAVAAELTHALQVWQEASDGALAFERVLGGVDAPPADLTIRFDDHTPRNRFSFDGPGGALAFTSSTSIAFDASERWELIAAPHGGVHPDRARLPEDFFYFGLLPVAIHEIGHVIGLPHSFGADDVMSPYYMRSRLQLSDVDKSALTLALV